MATVPNSVDKNRRKIPRAE